MHLYEFGLRVVEVTQREDGRIVILTEVMGEENRRYTFVQESDAPIVP